MRSLPAPHILCVCTHRRHNTTSVCTHRRPLTLCVCTPRRHIASSVWPFASTSKHQYALWLLSATSSRTLPAHCIISMAIRQHLKASVCTLAALCNLIAHSSLVLHIISMYPSPEFHIIHMHSSPPLHIARHQGHPAQGPKAHLKSRGHSKIRAARSSCMHPGVRPHGHHVPGPKNLSGTRPIARR